MMTLITLEELGPYPRNFFLKGAKVGLTVPEKQP